ncbi:MAG: phosphoglucomutase/phosphomannomutase family protein [bacterium]
MVKIKFGTAGWRGVISDEFTIGNVRLVTQAIANYIKEQATSDKQQVVVGYDTRFMSENFAKVSSRLLAANGIGALITTRDVPTPAFAYEILRRRTIGGINFTASHNPAEYNGIKFSSSWGGPALPETTNAIEKNCALLMEGGSSVRGISWEKGRKKGLINYVDPRPEYIKRISELVNLEGIRKAKLKVAVDLMYGTARDYLEAILKEAGCEVKVLHNWRDVLFGGSPPEPSSAYLGELVKTVEQEKCDLGLATDGDSDRFGIVDRDGTFISANQVLALLLNHLVKTRNWKGVVARSVMTTSFVDAIARIHHIRVKETAVGFKYIAQVMRQNGMVIGGEESGGLTIRGHIPEKDGILACLLMAEMVASEGKSIGEILDDLYRKVGLFLSERINFHLKEDEMGDLKAKLRKDLPREIAGLRVEKIVNLDGLKFILADGSWLGIRLSGTEPVVRLYIEAHEAEKLENLKEVGKDLIGKR